MNFTIRDANAVNEILAVVLQLEGDDEQARNSAIYLADKAHRTLGAGLTGEQVRKQWDLLEEAAS